jgi:hypothetical protein
LDASQIQAELLRQYSIRIGLRTAAYVHEHLAPSRAPTDGMLPIIGRDARTGTPLRKLISVSSLRSSDVTVPSGNPTA